MGKEGKVLHPKQSHFFKNAFKERLLFYLEKISRPAIAESLAGSHRKK